MDIQLIFDRGKECGIEDMEVYMVKNSSMNINIYEGNLEGYSIAEENALSIRGIYKGKMGYSYTEKIEEDSIEELLGNLIQYAESNEKEYIEVLAEPKEQYKDAKEKNDKLSKYTEEEKIDFLKSIEKEALNFDKRISIVENCSYEEYTNSVFIKNTKGLELEDKYSIGILNLSVVAKDGEDVQTGYSYMVIDDLSDEYKNTLVRDAVNDGINMLKATTIASGNYEIILRNNVVANLFNSMSRVFLGDVVQRNLSMMKGKIGEKVGSDLLNIVEDPLLNNGMISRTFDDEGNPTFSKYIIEKGILKTFLHNTKTAEKEGLESTGNGFRISHKGSIGVLPTNMYIEKGDSTLEDMIDSMDMGIMITDIQGLHAGINPTSGDFSLSSSGFLIEKGQISKPICQITIAGNFYKLLVNITAIGNDTKFSFPMMNYFGSPSIKLNSLTVAGN
ncbi:TldD/PmbA family protein [Sporanaerobacter acetigenes]|uniref:PmbA protein n=1 Tax=Sporanaerobacter acetigenes DSM 13106 TaxID=1123281 RepID=A0A1M5YMU8_9FIRM|nr:TldD/PmbA family protein [Sporanaerobacter acetigenes]SHI13229.1 PmbA protein [Sporanaerobacter acetigenes DSM 13106]